MALQFLKKARDLLPTGSPKFLLHRHMTKAYPGRPKTRVHASAVTADGGLCARQYALVAKLGIKPPDEYLTLSQELTFDIGRMVQDRLVHHFADMGHAIGHWKCLSCERLHEFCRRPFKCRCGCKAFKPEEVRFESAVSGVSCGIDMLLSLGEAKLRPIEIKTMDPKEFKDLAAPKGEHKLRTSLYLRLIAECEHPWAKQVSCERATVLYVSKGGFGVVDPELKKWVLPDRFSPLKEYAVTRNDPATEGVLAAAMRVKAWRDGGGMPGGVCATGLDPRAKDCEARKACWSGEHPAEEGMAA